MEPLQWEWGALELVSQSSEGTSMVWGPFLLSLSLPQLSKKKKKREIVSQGDM